MKKQLHIILFLFCVQLSLSQIEEKNNIVGKNYSLYSKVLQDTIKLQVKLPNGYSNSTTKYPLLLLLDGQDYFNYSVGIVQRFTKYEYTPEFIVAGIYLNNKQRNKWVFGNPDKFMESLESEILHYIDSNWHTSSERIVHGWEATGGFAIQLITKKPKLFNAYIAASPTPIYGAYFPSFKKQFLELERAIQSPKVKDKFLYVTESTDDFPVQYGMENLLKLLNEKASKDLRWKYKKLLNEQHPTTGFNTLFYGLQEYYFDYPDFDITNFDDFYEKGGLDYIDTYYTQRSRRYGFSKEQTEASKKHTRRSIIISAISQDNFQAFYDLMQKLKPKGFLDEQYLNQAYWYAVFYLKHHKPKEATEIFNFLAKKFPDSPRPYHGLGRVHKYLKDYTKAKTLFSKAVEIGKKNNDWRLEEYKTDLNKVIEK